MTLKAEDNISVSVCITCVTMYNLHSVPRVKKGLSSNVLCLTLVNKKKHLVDAITSYFVTDSVD